MASTHEQPVAVRIVAAVFVDPTDDNLITAISRSPRSSVIDAVRSELESHLDSVSYVRHASIHMNTERTGYMTVTIMPNDKANPPGKLADAELHFTEGPLLGLKLIGFAVWERRSGGGRNVTFPARQYAVNGERRSFSLLRPIGDAQAQENVRDLILQAYRDFEERESTRP